MNALAAVREARVPALRLKRWSWEDDDGDHAIASGDVVRIRALFFNHLADAARLTAGITVQEPYSFLDLRRSEADIGFLAGGDSVEVTFEFTVNAECAAEFSRFICTHMYRRSRWRIWPTCCPFVKSFPAGSSSESECPVYCHGW